MILQEGQLSQKGDMHPSEIHREVGGGARHSVRGDQLSPEIERHEMVTWSGGH